MRRLEVIQPSPIFARIAIVGLGFLGGSIALAARKAWPAGLVIGVDTNRVLEQAMVLYAVDVAAADLVIASEAELVILASSPARNIEALAELPDVIPGSALVTDVSGRTREISSAAAALPPRFTFIGGGPLVEDEGSILQSSADAFRGRPWILTPAAGIREADIDSLRRFVAGLGAEPRLVDHAEHDRMMEAEGPQR